MARSRIQLTVLLHAHDTRPQLRALEQAMAIVRRIADDQHRSHAPLRAFVLQDEQLEQLSRLPLARQWRGTSSGFAPLTESKLARERELARVVLERELATSSLGGTGLEPLLALAKFDDLWRALAERPSARRLLMPSSHTLNRVAAQRGSRVMVVITNLAQLEVWRRMWSRLNAQAERSLGVIVAVLDDPASPDSIQELRHAAEQSCDEGCVVTIARGDCPSLGLGAMARQFGINLLLCFVDGELGDDATEGSCMASRVHIEALLRELPCPLLLLNADQDVE